MFTSTSSIIASSARPCGLGAAAHHHRPHHQRGGEPDPDPRRQGHQPGAAQRVQSLLQPLRQGQWDTHTFTSDRMQGASLLLLTCRRGTAGWTPTISAHAWSPWVTIWWVTRKLCTDITNALGLNPSYKIHAHTIKALESVLIFYVSENGVSSAQEGCI